MITEFVLGDYVGDTYHHARFHPDRSVLHGCRFSACMIWHHLDPVLTGYKFSHESGGTNYRASTIRYDRIRDAILTCARKPTWVGLICRTETTTKNCKAEKLKSKSRYVRSNSKSLGNHVVTSEEEKERLQLEGFAEKEGFKSGIKERVSDEKLIA